MTTTIQLKDMTSSATSELRNSPELQSERGSTVVDVVGSRALSIKGANKEKHGSHSPTQKQRRTANLQLLTLCWNFMLTGWNDGSAGPLLPRIQEVYHVNFVIVSLIFVFACVGFIAGALMNIHLMDRYGFGKIIVFGTCMQIIAFAVKSAGPPFPVFILAYVLNGVGMALEDALANGYVGSLKSHAETKMGIMHAAYGIGALAATLSATQFSQMHRWSFHFLVSLAIAILNAVFLIVVFRFKTQDECLIEGGEPMPERSSVDQQNKFKTVMTTSSVHYLALFILLYVGVEVSIGGWIVTFIINERGGGTSSGYISSGFFGGLTLGRVVFLSLNKKIGEWRAIFLYTTIAIALEFTIWFVPSLIQNAVAVSIVGVLLGPMYPIAVNQAARILPRWILTGAVGWIAGFGQAGSALLPFMVGTIASKHGIACLQPLAVGTMVVMAAVWATVPQTDRRSD